MNTYRASIGERSVIISAPSRDKAIEVASTISDRTMPIVTELSDDECRSVWADWEEVQDEMD